MEKIPMSCNNENPSQQQQNKLHKLALCAILRHYWQLKTPADEAIAKIRQTEGTAHEADGLFTEELAIKWMGKFDAGELDLAKVIDDGHGEDMGIAISLAREEQLAKMECLISSVRMIPTELWVEVFSFLHARDFLCLEWISAHWRAIMIRFFWPKLCRLNAHVLHRYELCALSTRFGSQIRHLCLGPTLDQIHMPLRQLIGHMPDLESIRIARGCRAKDIDAIAELLPAIHHADLDLNFDNYTGLPAILHGCHELESLELAFSGGGNVQLTRRREFDLRVTVNSVPPGLKYLQAYDCGLFLPHLLEMAARDCSHNLQVLSTPMFYQTFFESTEVAVALMLFENLHFLQIGIELDVLKACIVHHPEPFRPLKGLNCGYFDYEFLSLLRKTCPGLEHLCVSLIPRSLGRSTYRALGHFVKTMPMLRALDVRDTAEYSHNWRTKCAYQLAKNGSKEMQFLNLMIDFPFEVFLMLVKNFKKLQYVNCFTIHGFRLQPLIDVLLQEGGSGPRVMHIGIINKAEFETNFKPLECPEFIQFQKYSIANPVEYECRQIVSKDADA